MKISKIAVSLIAAGVMASPLAYATNGDSMMSVGSQNTALGGTGVANFVGAESTFANPAMLAKSKGREATGGVVLFKPKVANDGMGGTAATSTADTNYIPDFSYSSRINDNLTYGLALAGIAGMGVDYTGASANHIKAKTALSILKVVPTIAYNDKDYGVGFSPVLQYGSLMISYDSTLMGGGPYNTAQKADTNTGYGYALGGYFNVMPALTVAAAYSSEIKMTYGTQLSGAGAGFGMVGANAFGDTLTQPAEMKAGVAYTLANNFTVTADYKLIQWASATGYKDYGWKDQTVLAVGGKYAASGYWIGVGYNNTDDPIGVTPSTGVPTNKPATVNFFNNMMFPAIVKSAYTFGGGYSFSEALDVEASVMIAPEVKKTVDVTAISPAPTNTTTHSQQSYSVSLRYKY